MNYQQRVLSRNFVQAELGTTRQAMLKSNAALSVSSVDTTNDTLTITAHGIGNNTGIKVLSTETIPAGLSTATTYYARSVNANEISLHTTLDGAQNNTGKVDITDAGSGTITVNGSAYTQLDFKTLNYGSSNWYNATTRRYTAQVACVVEVSASVYLGSNSGDTLTLRLWKNGIETGTLTGVALTRASANVNIDIIISPVLISMAANDYLEVTAELTGTTVRVIGANSGISNVSNTRILFCASY